MSKRFALGVVLAFLLSVSAWADVPIDESHFPDEVFRNFVSAADRDQDGILSDAEISAITRMGAQERGIKTLKGIEYFTGLTYLDCSDNLLTELDVSSNTALTTLYCSRNALDSVVK